MTAVSSIDLSGWLSEQLAQASPDLLRAMVKTFAEALMGAEADAVCGAGYGERSPDRVNSRNGYRAREWDTRAGTIEVAIPKLRTGSYFPDWLLERRRRAEAALVTVVATSYLLGVSTRRMEKLVATLGIDRLSRSQVSEMARHLDAQVAAFRTRPLDAGPYTFVAADALVIKVREDGRTVNVHAMVAVGVNRDGYREILGLQVASAEDGAGWLAFFRDLVARGLTGVQLVTSDAHAGLVAAIGATLPGASWQRCRTHYAANLMAACPKSRWGQVKALLHSIYDQPDTAAVHAQFDRVLDELQTTLPTVAEHLDAARADVLAFTAFPKHIWRQIWSNNPQGAAEPGDPPPHRRRRDLPRPRRPDPPGRGGAGRAARRVDRDAPLHRPGRPEAHWRKIWSTNPLERLNKEVKRRTDVVGIFPNDQALLRLAACVLIEHHDEWQVSDRRYLSEASMARLTPPAPTELEARRDGVANTTTEVIDNPALKSA